MALGRDQQAVEVCLGVLNSPNTKNIRYITCRILGKAYQKQKKYEKALPYLANYVAEQKEVAAQDLYQLSFCYFQSQQWKQAINGFKKLANVEDSLGQNSMYLLATSYLNK